MNRDTFIKYGGWIWLVALCAMGVSAWSLLFSGEGDWLDIVEIIYGVITVVYWLPLATNWRQMRDRFIEIRPTKAQGAHGDPSQYEGRLKRLRIIAIVLTVSAFFLAISNIGLILTKKWFIP
jgi:uncharacterized membrane protein